METQDKSTVLLDRLMALGYTPGQAANRLGCSRTHLYCVLTGERTSPELLKKAFALPKRKLRLREKSSTPKA